MGWNRGMGWAGTPPAQIDIPRIIDVTDTEAFLVRKDADGGDIFVVDTTNGTVSFGGVTPVTGTRILVPQENDAATPTIAFGDGDSGFYESVDDTVALATIGSVRWLWTNLAFQGAGFSASPAMRETSTTSTNPSFTPHRGDLDTGIGRGAADQLSLIAGGVEGARITEAQRTIETNATVAETDGGDLRIVTVAAHSLSIDDVVQFADGTGTISTDLIAATNYYVTQVDDANKFNISTSRGGSNVTFNDAGTAFDSFQQEITVNNYGKVIVPQETDGAAAPTLAFGDGDSGFYESSDDTVRFAAVGVARWQITSTTFDSLGAAAAPVLISGGSSTAPCFRFAGDTNTGIGWAGADQLSLIAGGVERARFMINDTELNIVCVDDAVVCINDAVVFV